MSTPWLIIDGYNVIHKSHELKQIAQHKLESAREKLIQMISGYLQGKNVNALLVFDGQYIPGAQDTYWVHDKIKVVYSRQPKSADDIITHHIRHRDYLGSKAGEITIVSSDWKDIGTVAQTYGFAIVPSRQFLSKLQKRLKSKSTVKKPEIQSNADIERWLKLFTQPKESSE